MYHVSTDLTIFIHYLITHAQKIVLLSSTVVRGILVELICFIALWSLKFGVCSEVISICLAAPTPVPPLSGSMTTGTNSRTTAKIASSSITYDSLKDKVPSPVGKYLPAMKSGGLLFLVGVRPRSPVDNSIHRGPVFDEDGNTLD